MSNPSPDYGADPLGNGMFKMVPSGEVVTRAEKEKRLPRKRIIRNDCLGMSWEQLGAKQGNKIKH